MDELHFISELEMSGFPKWLSMAMSVIGEAILLLVTIAIITAMWIPAYLINNRPHAVSLAEPRHDGPPGMPARGR